MGFPHYPIRLPLILAGVILAVFLPVCGYEFVSYDDGFNIYNNWRVTTFSPANLAYFWKAPYENLYIPLTYSVWSVLALLAKLPGEGKWGLDPGVFHAANLMLHLGCALVVFGIIKRLVANAWAAWAGALLFAIHPVQVEAVAWATGLKDLLSAFWALLAIQQYLVHDGFVGNGHLGRRAVIPYGSVALCFGLAILAKPGAVAVPLLLVVIGRFWLRRDWRRLALEVLPLLLLTVPVILMTKAAQPDTSQAWQPEVWQRFLVGGDALSHYLFKVLVPAPLAPDYGRTPRLVLGQPLVYLTVLVPVVALILRWRFRQAGRWLVAGDIFVLSLLPVLGLISFDFQNISTVADRYLYLAMLGPGLAIAWALARSNRRCSWGILGVVVVVLAAMSMAQMRHWRDSASLTSHALAVNPRSWVMNSNLGLEMVESGRHEEAIAAFTRALAANPNYAEAYNNLGALYQQLGQDRDAIECFTKSLAVNPSNVKAAFNLAMLFQARDQPMQALEHYRRALAAQPDFLEAANNMGLIYLELRQPTAAVDIYLQAMVLSPDHPLLHFNLARAYAELGRGQESIAELRRATEIEPSFAPAYHQLYHAYMELGDEATALAYRALAVKHRFALDQCPSCWGGGEAR